MLKVPLEELSQLVQDKKFIGKDSIDFDSLEKLGVFILRDAIDSKRIEYYLNHFKREVNDGLLKKTLHHMTEIKIENSNSLKLIAEEPDLIGICSCFFDGNVGSDNIRIVKKDKENFAPVFLHQDTCYQIGGFQRYSLFIALTDANSDNGGLILYPGSHNFGYLGDAGEINEEVLPKNYPIISSDLSPGDVLIMHSAIWHKSPENLSKKDRIYLEIHIQNIDEPTTSIEICGSRVSSWRMTLNEDEIFKNSRVKKIKTLYKEIDDLKMKLESRL